MTEPIIEALKELARVVVLAVIPVIVSGLNAETGQININPNVVLVVIALALLRCLDKWLHEWGKELKNDDWERGETVMKGLTRF